MIHGGRNLLEVVSDLEAAAVAHKAEAAARSAGEAAAAQARALPSARLNLSLDRLSNYSCRLLERLSDYSCRLLDRLSDYICRLLERLSNQLAQHWRRPSARCTRPACRWA